MGVVIMDALLEPVVRQLKDMGVKVPDGITDAQLIRIAVKTMQAMTTAYLQVVDMAEAISGTQVVPREEVELLRTKPKTGFTVEDNR